MNDVLKPIDVNQLLRDAKNYSMSLESFEVDWVEKKGQVDYTGPGNMLRWHEGTVLVPIIKIKYRESQD